MVRADDLVMRAADLVLGADDLVTGAILLSVWSGAGGIWGLKEKGARVFRRERLFCWERGEMEKGENEEKKVLVVF